MNMEPPTNALRVNAWRDMPTDTARARYVITDDDTTFTVSKGNRRVLDALIRGPVYAASPVRISDRVCILRNQYNVPITIEMYENDTDTDRARYGVYFLSGVRRVADAKVYGG